MGKKVRNYIIYSILITSLIATHTTAYGKETDLDIDTITITAPEENRDNKTMDDTDFDTDESTVSKPSIEYEINPDLLLTGTNEEYEQTTFHRLNLPYEKKDEGIVVAIPAPNKGRIHYYLGVDIDSAKIIKPEVYTDIELTSPLTNRYESDEVYDYYYNFNVPQEGICYLKLTAPEYNMEEDLSIRFSVQFYSGADRKLTENVQVFNAVIDEIPTYYQIDVPEDGTIHISADNYMKEIPTVLTLCNEDKEEISDPASRKEGSQVNVSFDVNAGTYYIKATDENDYYRIIYTFSKSPVIEEKVKKDTTSTKDKVVALPKTGDTSSIWRYLMVFTLGQLALLGFFAAKRTK